jgi:coenzyme PQQ precursor peptide PqqA
LGQPGRTSVPSSNEVVAFPSTRRFTMTWQTPTATDYRFGFEISLYVSNR